MSVLTMILLATLLGGVISMALAALLAFRLSQNARVILIAFAAGVMLSSAWLDILPEAVEAMQETTREDAHGAHAHGGHDIRHEHDIRHVEHGGAHGKHEGHGADAHGEHAERHHHGGPFFRLFATVFLGILGFFALEHLAIWRHAHAGEGHAAHEGVVSAAPLILIGDAFHNFVDGFLIAAAFIVDPFLGVTATFAIITHEIPQELGDFVVLLHAGYGRARAFLANAVSSLTAVLGGFIGYFFMADARVFLPYVLALAAASFIYIALADLIPMLRHEPGHNRRFTRQFALIALGGAIVPVIGLWAHH
ncbi:MAG: ZIP family metal transporter [Zoogloeaceae bacterium]|jgi:zinc and cadmium transporter|nr:ZIP family metal transporter [Zoogloeaceae bacterium]